MDAMLIWIAMQALSGVAGVQQDPVEKDTPTQMTKPKPPEKPAEKEVVVIGQRRESDVLDVASSVTLITRQAIAESGSRNIVDVLQRAPGFFASGYGPTAADKNLDLRGFNNGGGNGQRTLVLVDGRKTNNVTTSSTDWASIPLQNIERIEIVRGPASALYGDTAMAGVVNIITRRGGEETFSRTQATGGNWGTYRGAANLGGTSEGILYDVYAGLEGTQGYRDHADYYGNDFTGRLEAPLAEGLKGFFKLGRHEDDRERPGSLSKADIAQFGRKASVIAGSPSESERTEVYVDGGATQALGAWGELSLFLNHTRGEAESTSFSGFGDFFLDDAFAITMLQLKHVVAPKIFGREAAFTTGVDLSYEDAEAESYFVGPPTDETEYRRRLAGAFTHAEIRPLEELILSGSLRWDRALLDLDTDPGFGGGQDEQRAFDQLSPHVGLTWKVLQELSAFASWGRTFKYPTRDELLGFTSFTPGLDPERATTAEVGVRAWTSSWGSASVSGFHMRVKDEIYFDPFNGFFGSNVNIEEVLHTGVESELRATPWTWVEIFATHTYVRATIEEHTDPALEGNRYPVTPRLCGTVGGTLRYEGAAFTATGLYTGERRLVNDIGNTRDTLGSHWLLDLRVAYEIKFVKVFAGVHNVFDREVFDNGGFSVSSGTERFSPFPERSWELGGEVRF
jgi:iron complex outermembrane receptor protein